MYDKLKSEHLIKESKLTPVYSRVGGWHLVEVCACALGSSRTHLGTVAALTWGWGTFLYKAGCRREP